MQSYRNKYGFERHCWAEIDLDALRDNFAYVHRTAGRPVCAVSIYCFYFLCGR